LLLSPVAAVKRTLKTLATQTTLKTHATQTMLATRTTLVTLVTLATLATLSKAAAALRSEATQIRDPRYSPGVFFFVRVFG